ncbi:MAG TPA: hypothetical protein VGX78_06835 [Pirellulales bacterium]|nr:hypothetical protein [Pirellulales bacterium]
MNTATKQRSKRHIEVKLAQTAVAALALAHLPHTKCSWDGGVLTVRYDDRLLRIDEATGRMLEQLSTDEEYAPWSQTRLTTLGGEFARRLQSIEAAAADLPNGADDERPLSCVCDFVCEEALAMPLEARRAFVTLNKLVDLGLFQPIDGMMAEAFLPSRAEDEFSIPRGNLVVGEVDDITRMMRVSSTAWGMPASDYLLPRDTWAWRLWRETMFRCAEVGRSDCPEKTNNGPSGDTGALGCFVASLVARLDASARSSAAAAAAGLRRLSLKEFRRDYEALLDRKGFVGRYAWQHAEVVRGLDEQDLQWLEQATIAVECLDPAEAEVLFEVARLLRRSDQALDVTLPAVLETWWKLGLRKSVEATLKQIARWPSAPRAGVSTAGAVRASPEGATAWRPGGTTDYRVNAAHRGTLGTYGAFQPGDEVDTANPSAVGTYHRNPLKDETDENPSARPHFTPTVPGFVPIEFPPVDVAPTGDRYARPAPSDDDESAEATTPKRASVAHLRGTRQSAAPPSTRRVGQRRIFGRQWR